MIFEKFIRDKVSLLDTGVRINALKAITDTREETAAPPSAGLNPAGLAPFIRT